MVETAATKRKIVSWATNPTSPPTNVKLFQSATFRKPNFLKPIPSVLVNAKTQRNITRYITAIDTKRFHVCPAKTEAAIPAPICTTANTHKKRRIDFRILFKVFTPK